VPCAGAIYAHWEVVVPVTALEYTCVVVGWHVPETPHLVENMVAQARSLRPNTSTEAELSIGDKARPFMVLLSIAKRVSKYQTANRISLAISTTIIQLPTLIPLGNIYLSKVTYACNLYIIGRFDEMHAFECAVGDCACPASGFSAPCYFFAFCVAYCSRGWWCPETEVVRRVDPSSLTIRRRATPTSARVRTELLRLRCTRELRGHISRVPDLIGIIPRASPHLYPIPITQIPIRQIQTLAMIRPRKMIIPRIIKLLIRIPTCALPNL